MKKRLSRKNQATPVAIADAWSREFTRLRAMGVHLRAAEYFAGVARRMTARGDVYVPYVPDANVRRDLSIHVPPVGPTLQAILDRKSSDLPARPVAISPYASRVSRTMLRERTLNVWGHGKFAPLV